MEEQPKKAWQVLCEQAAKEQDPQRLMVLVGEISRLLDEEVNNRTARGAA